MYQSPRLFPEEYPPDTHCTGKTSKAIYYRLSPLLDYTPTQHHQYPARIVWGRFGGVSIVFKV